MAGNNESTMKWKVDVSQLKTAMTDAKRSIQQANAEFKTATAGMDKWSKSSEGLEAKVKQLNKILPEQKKVLKALEDQYAEVTKEQGEDSKAAHDLKLKIEEQKAAVKKTETSISTFSDKLAEMKQKEADSESAMGKLTAKIEEQEGELKDLKKQYENAVLEFGEGSDEAKELADNIGKLSGELKDNKTKLNDAQTAADKFDTSLEETDKDAEHAGGNSGGISAMQVALGNLITQGIDLAIDALKNLATAAGNAWKEFDSGVDIITAKTGATGESAKELQNVYKNVSKQVVGSFDDIGTAVGEINTRFGLSGDELEDLSVQFLQFSKLNGTNVNSSIDKVQSTMAAWGLTTDQTSTFLDLLNKAGQDTGVSVDALADSLKQNAPALQEMGLSAADSATFLASLDKNGLDTSSTMAGLKKALTNAAKEGKPMSQALSEVEDNILNAKDSTEAVTTATELFGSKSGAAIANAVRSGRISFKDFGDTLTGFKGNVKKTFEATQDPTDEFALAIQGIKTDTAEMVGEFMKKYAPQIKRALNTAKDAVQKLFGIVEKFFQFIEKNGDAVLAVLTGIVTAFIAFKTITIVAAVIGTFVKLFGLIKAGTGIMAAFNAVMAVNPFVLIAAAIAGLIAAFVVLWNKSDAFREFWLNLWDSIKDVASNVWEGYIKPVFTAIADGATWLWENVLQPVFSKLKEIFETVIGVIQNLWENVLKPVFQAVGDVFTFLWENILSPYLNAIKDTFKLVFEGIQTLWNSVLKPVFEKIGEIFGWLWEKVLSPTITNVKEGFRLCFEGIQTVWNEVLKPVFEKIGEVFKHVWEDVMIPVINTMRTAFRNFADTIKGIFEGIWGAIKKVINGILGGMETLANGVVGGMNKVIDAMNNLHFELPDWLGGYSVGFNLDHLKEVSLPRLFRGGVLKQGQVGLLEGSGAEAVVPLERNKAWISAVVKGMLSQMNIQGARSAVGSSVFAMNGGSGSTTKTVTQNITFNQTNNSPKALDRLTVYRDTNNLLFSAKVRMGDV